jgi:hypothetical protein
VGALFFLQYTEYLSNAQKNPHPFSNRGDPVVSYDVAKHPAPEEFHKANQLLNNQIFVRFLPFRLSGISVLLWTFAFSLIPF